MSKSKHIRIELTADERSHLETLIRSGNAPARMQTQARILLLSDRRQGEAKTETQIAEALLCSKNTVGNIRRRFAQEGLQAALSEKPRPGGKPKIDGEIEARLIALACSAPPSGKGHWTVRLLADKAIELGLIESISHVAVYQRLKKMKSSPGG
jgi:hypothetical protein